MHSAKIFLFAIPAISAVADNEGVRLFANSRADARRKSLEECSEQQIQDYESLWGLLKAAKKADADLPALRAQYAELKQADTEGCEILRHSLQTFAMIQNSQIRVLVDKIENSE